MREFDDEETKQETNEFVQSKQIYPRNFAITMTKAASWPGHVLAVRCRNVFSTSRGASSAG
jgi:hypothetical protein